jgi:hypothetical protein
MSVITDVVVVAMYPEPGAIAFVNAALDSGDGNNGQHLEPLNMAAAGGSKVITACVYAASFNYLACSEMKEALLAAPWEIPGSVTICVAGETHDEEFKPPARQGG